MKLLTLLLVALSMPVAASAAPLTLDCAMAHSGRTYVISLFEGSRGLTLTFDGERYEADPDTNVNVGGELVFNKIIDFNDSLIHFGKTTLRGRYPFTQHIFWSVSISRSTGAITITGPLAGVGQCERASDKKKF
jgi:hypothetical protein